MKRVLVLGAGLVTRPIVRFFLDDPEVRLTVATLYLEHAEGLIDGHDEGRAIEVDVSNPEQLAPLIADCDLVVSLVPYAFHPIVARLAIDNGVHMVSTSYVSPEMRALDADAKQAGIVLLNEIGLDPGLDHMSAMRMIDDVHDSGGSVTSFKSCCGGLPSPSAANNPWRYKFSWSPRGALLAGRLAARYLEHGNIHNIPGEDLFGHKWPYDVEALGQFEVYPNRDSLKYVRLYALEGVKTMLRGTIRYPGWCETMKVLADLDMLDVDKREWPADTTYADFVAAFLPAGDGSVPERLAARAGVKPDHAIVERFAWAGLFADEPLPSQTASPLDVLAGRFEERMVYAPGERDMVVQRHEIVATWPHAERPAERRLSLLIAYGEPDGDTATARTVSLPAALGARMILDGKLPLSGVHIPIRREIYGPVLDGLEARGIVFKEWSEPV